MFISIYCDLCVKYSLIRVYLLLNQYVCLFMHTQRERERDTHTHTRTYGILALWIFNIPFFVVGTSHTMKRACVIHARAHTQTLAPMLPFTRTNPRAAMPTSVRPDSLSLSPQQALPWPKHADWASFWRILKPCFAQVACVFERERECVRVAHVDINIPFWKHGRICASLTCAYTRKYAHVSVHVLYTHFHYISYIYIYIHTYIYFSVCTFVLH